MPPRGPDAIDRRLIERLQGPLPMCERPFAVVGSELGLAEDEVIDRLRHLLAQGVVAHFGPLFAGAAGDDGAKPDDSQPAFASLQVPAADFDRDLITATFSGLPLLARPYEALGAMLGASGASVRARLASMLEDGTIRRIGVVLRQKRPTR